MTQFIKNIISFSFFAIAIYVIMICIAGDFGSQKTNRNLPYEKGKAGHSFHRFHEAKQTKNIDILFLGSSHTYRGFDNRIFYNNGFTSFNLGSSSQTPIQTQLLLDRYLEQLNPKVVIYEVFPITFTLDGIESTLDLIANEENDFDLVKVTFNDPHIKVFNSLLYDVYRETFYTDEDFDENKILKSDKYISGGFVEKIKSVYKSKSHKKLKLDFIKEQIRIFKQNLKTLKDKGIQVYLVHAPITIDYYKSLENLKEFDSMMNELGNYYDFNKLVQLTDSLHFFDHHHLNQKGVEIFNQKVIEVIFQKKN